MRSNTAGTSDLFQLFVINLERRPDRLAQIAGALDRLDLAYTHIKAVDANSVSRDLLNLHFESSGPFGAMSAGDKCCTLSHRLVWRAMAEASCDWGIVLEDDVVLSDSFGAVLDDIPSIPPDIELIKLERCNYSHLALLSNATPGPAGHTLHRLLSKHACSAGYMIRRSGALKALEFTQRTSFSIDHVLFNPSVSSLCRRLVPYQLCPAVVEQAELTPGEAAVSDIKPWRLKARPFGIELWQREIIRAYYEVRLLPLQLVQLAAGARFIQIEFGRRSKTDAGVKNSKI